MIGNIIVDQVNKQKLTLAWLSMIITLLSTLCIVDDVSSKEAALQKHKVKEKIMSTNPLIALFLNCKKKTFFRPARHAKQHIKSIFFVFDFAYYIILFILFFVIITYSFNEGKDQVTGFTDVV